VARPRRRHLPQRPLADPARRQRRNRAERRVAGRAALSLNPLAGGAGRSGQTKPQTERRPARSPRPEKPTILPMSYSTSWDLTRRRPSYESWPDWRNYWRAASGARPEASRLQRFSRTCTPLPKRACAGSIPAGGIAYTTEITSWAGMWLGAWVKVVHEVDIEGRWRGAHTTTSARPPIANRSSAGSCRRMAWWSDRSVGLGSSPSSSCRNLRASRKAASASACLPAR
jgi:hypothetical protein